MKERPISLGNIYEYWGTIRERKNYGHGDYELCKQSILDHVKDNGSIVLDLTPYSSEVLNFPEFEKRFDEIVDKVESLTDVQNG